MFFTLSISSASYTSLSSKLYSSPSMFILIRSIESIFSSFITSDMFLNIIASLLALSIGVIELASSEI